MDSRLVKKSFNLVKKKSEGQMFLKIIFRKTKERYIKNGISNSSTSRQVMSQ